MQQLGEVGVVIELTRPAWPVACSSECEHGQSGRSAVTVYQKAAFNFVLNTEAEMGLDIRRDCLTSETYIAIVHRTGDEGSN